MIEKPAKKATKKGKTAEANESEPSEVSQNLKSVQKTFFHGNQKFTNRNWKI